MGNLPAGFYFIVVDLTVRDYSIIRKKFLLPRSGPSFVSSKKCTDKSFGCQPVQCDSKKGCQCTHHRPLDIRNNVCMGRLSDWPYLGQTSGGVNCEKCCAGAAEDRDKNASPDQHNRCNNCIKDACGEAFKPGQSSIDRDLKRRSGCFTTTSSLTWRRILSNSCRPCSFH